jgi:hypothetical protein
MVDPLPVFLTTLTPPDFSSWIVVLFCLITIGFFSGMEIAFISANKLRIELKSKHGSFGGKWLTRYIKKPNEFISTVLVATNLALVIYGIAIGDILSYYLTKFVSNTFLVFLLTTVISTLLVLVTAEFIPKTIFKLQADSLIFQTEKQLKEYGDKIPADKKGTIESSLEELKTAHKSQDLGNIDTAVAALNAAWTAASEDIYKATQDGGAQQAQPDAAQDAGASNENVTDAEFEEVK